MSIETYEADTFSLILTWTLADGAVKDLTGATVEAHARNLQTGAEVPLTASVIDGEAGQVRVSAASFAFPPSVQDIQITVTKDAITRTHTERLIVRDSIKAAS